MPAQHLILDAMGVVFVNEDDLEELLIPYLSKRFDFDKNLLRDLYFNELSLGKISSDEFFSRLQIPNVEEEYLSTSIRIDDEFLSVAERLTERFEISMLSNYVSEWSLFLKEMHNLERYFKNFIVSGDVGCRKPDKEMYEITLDILHAKADDCILVDNFLKNLKPASEIGFKTIFFQRSEQKTDYTPDFTVKSFKVLTEILLQSG